jgi:zinc protease
LTIYLLKAVKIFEFHLSGEKNMRYVFFLSVILVLICINACSGARPSGKTPSSAGTPLPVDTSITIAELENGVKYYIRNNQKPENRAELRLVLNAGSILEDNDQQGLAHFAEHMAFNGTENFARQELVNYLESVGMRFGPDLNAYTGFDETVYMLQIPTDSSQIVKTAFQILEEWAHRVSFEDEEIDRERGVVIEEWRLGRGAEARMRDRQFPVLFKDSFYAERLPIGKKAVLDTFHYDTLRRFYADWYRPDLMAVVAVGDFDRVMIENLIKEHFSGISMPPEPPERVLYPVPDHNRPLFTIATDPEATGSRVSVYYKSDLQEEGTEEAYRRSLVEALYSGMFNQRLNELRQLPDPPFLFAFTGQGRFVRTKEVYLLTAAVKDNQVQSGLETLLTEAARIKKYGFTSSELEREKLEMLSRMERAYNERDKTESRRYAAEYIRNYLTDEPIPGIEYEYHLYQKYIPEISLPEVNRVAGELITDKNRVVLVNAPEKEGITVPTETELAAVFATVSQKEITPYEDAVSEEPLIAAPPTPGLIAEENLIKEIGVTEWILSNGLKVILKPTDFKNDQVIFRAYSPGGNSLVDNEDYIPALTAASLIAGGGVGSFNRIELDKKLAGKVVRVSPIIGELTEGFSGSATPADVETMFQLIYLYFTAPRQDSTAFLSYQSRIKGFLENRDANPENAFRDTIAVTMAQHHYRARPWSEELLQEMDLLRSYAIYKDRFADAGDFTFFFVGNIDPEVFRPLVKTYLAGLPKLDRKESWQDVGISPPRGIFKKEVRKGLEDKSRVRIFFSGPFEWNRQNRYDINSLSAVLRIKLRESLREDKGGTYGVGVGASPSQYPDPDYQFSVSFGCSPDRVEELVYTVFEQIDSLKQFGAGQEYLQKVKEMQRREYETDLKENRFWLSSLRFYYFHGEDPRNIFELEKYIENLNSGAIKTAARKYLNQDNYVMVVLYPEEMK